VSGLGHTPRFFRRSVSVRLSRAVLFIDGSNWYHSLRNAGITGAGDLNYAKLSKKLAGASRSWVGTRFYIGRVNQREARKLYADQRWFLSRLVATDSRISIHFGRLESRSIENTCAVELREYLASLPVRIPPPVFHGLMRIAKRHGNLRVTAEKAVDVKLAVDMVMMAQRGEYEAAYLLSADGDFTPAVESVRALGKNVYVASPARGAQLAAVATTYIPLKGDFLKDCW
jgi:uncharacterized LabA/DUF88 family protein